MGSRGGRGSLWFGIIFGPLLLAQIGVGVGLWVEIPSQFKLHRHWKRGWMEYFEYLKPEKGNRTEVLAILVGSGKRSDPGKFLKLWEKVLRRECPAGRLEVIGESPGRWIEWSWRCPGREYLFGKGLKGEKGFYLVRWQFLGGEPTPGEEGRVLEFLKRVRVIEEGNR